MNYKGENGYEVLYPLIYTNLIPLSEVINTLFEYPDGTKLDSALAQLFLGASNYGYVIQVNDYNGNPVEGATITGSGISKPGGGSLVTSASGQIVVTSTATSINVGVTSPYIDLLNADSAQINSTGQLSYYTFTLADNVNVAQVHVTVKYPSGNPVQNTSVSGVQSRTKQSVTTNDDGICDGWSTIGGSLSVGNQGYYDLNSTNIKPSLVHGQINEIEMTLSRKTTNSAILTGSGTIKFSPEVISFDCSGVGSGGGGGKMSYSGGNGHGGAGGNGGGVSNKANITYNGGVINYSVGSASSGAYTTIIYNNQNQIYAYSLQTRGGAGGTKFDNPGDGSAPQNFLYPRTNGVGGGGGGGACQIDGKGSSSGGAGGPGGGWGGNAVRGADSNNNGRSATGYGGGGGGAGVYNYGGSGSGAYGSPGSGRSGCVGIVWHYAS